MMATEAEIRSWCIAYLREIFGRTAGDVRVDMKFSRFGMDSAMAVEFALALEEWLQIEIPAEVVYEYPTVSELAGYLAERSNSA
jgi:acyl carrier protein